METAELVATLNIEYRDFFLEQKGKIPVSDWPTSEPFKRLQARLKFLDELCIQLEYLEAENVRLKTNNQLFVGLSETIVDKMEKSRVSEATVLMPVHKDQLKWILKMLNHVKKQEEYKL